MRRRFSSTALVGALLLGLLIGSRGLVPSFDADGYQRNPSLWDLFSGTPVEAQVRRLSMYRSVQAGSCTVNTGATTCTAAITAVTSANTVLVFNGTKAAASSAEGMNARVELTSTTQVRGRATTPPSRQLRADLHGGRVLRPGPHGQQGASG